MAEVLQIVGSGGGVVAVIAVVWIFLKDRQEDRDAYMSNLKEISNDCHTQHERSEKRFAELAEKGHAVIAENSEVLRRSYQASGAILNAIARNGEEHDNNQSSSEID